MKKVVSIILGIVIFAIPCLCFASPEWQDGSGSPYILPLSDTPSFSVELSNGTTVKYSASSYPVYYVPFKIDGQSGTYELMFSEDPNVTVYYLSGSSPGYHVLSSEYNGFYYSSKLTTVNVSNIPVLIGASSATDVIDFVNNTVFKTTFDLSYITNGAVSWLSAVVDGVMQEPLLLFLILSSLSGIAIGLLFRFKRG